MNLMLENSRIPPNRFYTGRFLQKTECSNEPLTNLTYSIMTEIDQGFKKVTHHDSIS